MKWVKNLLLKGSKESTSPSTSLGAELIYAQMTFEHILSKSFWRGILRRHLAIWIWELEKKLEKDKKNFTCRVFDYFATFLMDPSNQKLSNHDTERK